MANQRRATKTNRSPDSWPQTRFASCVDVSCRSRRSGAANECRVTRQRSTKARRSRRRLRLRLRPRKEPDRTPCICSSGRSLVITSPTPIKRVSVADPNIAEAVVVSPYQLLLNGKAPGGVSLLVWDESDQSQTFEVSVDIDILSLNEKIHEVFPDRRRFSWKPPRTS